MKAGLDVFLMSTCENNTYVDEVPDDAVVHAPMRTCSPIASWLADDIPFKLHGLFVGRFVGCW